MRSACLVACCWRADRHSRVFFFSYEHYAENQRRASESLVAIEKLCVHAQPCCSLWCVCAAALTTCAAPPPPPPRPEAKAFFDDLRRNPRCSGNTIRSYLIMPVQRIPRYRLLAMVRWFRRFHVLCGRM